MNKQLDILYLFKRITFLERAIGALLTDNQVRSLHLFKKRTLAEAIKDRRQFKWNNENFLFRAGSSVPCPNEANGLETIQRQAEEPGNSFDNSPDKKEVTCEVMFDSNFN